MEARALFQHLSGSSARASWAEATMPSTSCWATTSSYACLAWKWSQVLVTLVWMRVPPVSSCYNFDRLMSVLISSPWVMVGSAGTKDPQKGKEVLLNLGDGTQKGDSDTYISLSIPVDPGFGRPGAISIESCDSNEFFLKSVTLTLPDPAGTTVFFPCHSWINHVKFNSGRPRLFFSNQVDRSMTSLFL